MLDGPTVEVQRSERSDCVVSRTEPRAGDDLDPVWKALANGTRREILDALVDGPATTGELAAVFEGLSRFAVMQHLAVLEKADLVIARKQGRMRFNHLNPVPIQQISDRWISRYQRPLAEAMVDLKVSLEAESAGSQETAHGTLATKTGTGTSE